MAMPHLKETWSFRNGRAMSADAPGLLLSLARQHGPSFKLGVGPVSLTVTGEPVALQHLLQKGTKNWGRGNSADRIRPLLGNGLPLADPPDWLVNRRTMQPAFHKGHGPQWVRLMREVMTPFVSGLPRETGPRSVRTLMMEIAREVIVRSMFSQSLAGESKRIEHDLHVVEDYVSRTAISAVPLPTWLPLPLQIRFRRAVRSLHALIREVIAARRATAEPPADLLTMLIRATDPETGRGMSDDQLVSELVNIFFAGHETTANLMTWATLLLSMHPQVRERAQAEVREVLGDRPIGPDDVARLPWLAAIVRETLRLYPPAWLFARQAFADEGDDGVPAKKGDVVLVVPYITHRLEAFWPNPDAFDPSRFLGESSTDAASWKWRYLPFGAGPHVCIGNHFALLEATVVLGTLLQHGHFEVPNPEAAKPKMGATLFVENGLPARWVPRR